MYKQANPVLVEIYRGGELESFHRGVVCVVNNKGEVIYSEGDIHQVCYSRSALKFFQHIPLIESGAVEHFGFTPEEIAVMCGSHNGESEHLRVVDSILQKTGLTRDHLRCGPQYPTLKKDFIPLYKSGEPAQQVHNNCSGKHAGFLAYCVFKGLDPADYINPGHPLQKEVLRVCAEMHEYPAGQMTIALDGCSAPIFAIPVYNQALAYKNLVHPEQFGPERQKACRTIVNAVQSYPFMVAGSQRYCTDMMKLCGRQVIGKTGAEGVFSLSLVDKGIGVSIKIDDGKMLPQYNVAQCFIEATGLFNAEQLESLRTYKQNDIRNFNKYVTGEIKPREGLFEGLSV